MSWTVLTVTKDMSWTVLTFVTSDKSWTVTSDMSWTVLTCEYFRRESVKIMAYNTHRYVS